MLVGIEKLKPIQAHEPVATTHYVVVLYQHWLVVDPWEAFDSLVPMQQISLKGNLVQKEHAYIHPCWLAPWRRWFCLVNLKKKNLKKEGEFRFKLSWPWLVDGGGLGTQDNNEKRPRTEQEYKKCYYSETWTTRCRRLALNRNGSTIQDVLIVEVISSSTLRSTYVIWITTYDII